MHDRLLLRAAGEGDQAEHGEGGMVGILTNIEQSGTLAASGSPRNGAQAAAVRGSRPVL
jgi:hypothetical protein